MDINHKAAHFLASYADPPQIEGGLVFDKALTQAKLDWAELMLSRSIFNAIGKYYKSPLRNPTA